LRRRSGEGTEEDDAATWTPARGSSGCELADGTDTNAWCEDVDELRAEEENAEGGGATDGSHSIVVVALEGLVSCGAPLVAACRIGEELEEETVEEEEADMAGEAISGVVRHSGMLDGCDREAARRLRGRAGELSADVRFRGGKARDGAIDKTGDAPKGKNGIAGKAGRETPEGNDAAMPIGDEDGKPPEGKGCAGKGPGRNPAAMAICCKMCGGSVKEIVLGKNGEPIIMGSAGTMPARLEGCIEPAAWEGIIIEKEAGKGKDGEATLVGPAVNGADGNA